MIGAGPSGILAAKHAVEAGFGVTVFEASDGLGGQWHTTAAHSGVWPGMRTNTSRVMTRFSDMDYPPGTAVYPSDGEVLAYLKRYCERFEIAGHVRLGTRVERIGRGPDGVGWEVRSVDQFGRPASELFPLVIVASGRFTRPRVPHVPGLESFSGRGGAAHSFQYKDPGRYRGMRVLVAGCAVSALEIAGDLAMLGAARVVSSYRRQRYVLPKLAAGVPTDHLAFTRYGALAAEVFPPETLAEGLKDLVLRTSGSPERFGAAAPAESLLEAGVTLSQHFLPLVAEGRIVTKPWMREIEGRTVRFADGSEEEFDALIFGTGFDLDLPFLAEDVREQLAVDDRHADLHHFTFHPALEGLAFLGLFDQVGPYLPVLELQARWIVYTWAGVVAPPTPDELAESVAAYRARRGTVQKQKVHVLARRFARLAGVEPEAREWPELARALLFGPLAPSSFRLSGPESLPDAAERLARDAAEFGVIASPDFTAEEHARLEALGDALGDAGLAALARVRSGKGA